MKRLAIIGFLFLTACATTTPNEPNADVLLQRDREFAKASAAHGYVAWQEFMAPNAAKPANGGRMLIGPQEIGDNMLAAFLSGFKLSWEPARVEISRGGKLGYTWGRYHSSANGKTHDGNYVTVWEKQQDGKWKVLFDTADAD
jgi:ketosteroid isomerase-like protein